MIFTMMLYFYINTDTDGKPRDLLFLISQLRSVTFGVIFQIICKIFGKVYQFLSFLYLLL